MTIASLAPLGAVTALNSSGGMRGKITPTITVTDHLNHILFQTKPLKLAKAAYIKSAAVST
jgi:hypothetical protein